MKHKIIKHSPIKIILLETFITGINIAFLTSHSKRITLCRINAGKLLDFIHLEAEIEINGAT